MNKNKKIAVLNYRMSNMFSIRNALYTLGFDAIVTSDYKTIMSCDGAILPGVGAFPEAMKNIFLHSAIIVQTPGITSIWSSPVKLNKILHPGTIA